MADSDELKTNLGFLDSNTDSPIQQGVTDTSRKPNEPPERKNNSSSKDRRLLRVDIHTLKPLTEVLLDLGRDRYYAVESDDLHACGGTSVFLAVQEMYPLVNRNELLEAYYTSKVHPASFVAVGMPRVPDKVSRTTKQPFLTLYGRPLLLGRSCVSKPQQ